MYLDERSNLILKAVLSNPEISNTELENKFSLTRRQISYSFSKINNWLEEKNYPIIKRTNSGKFILSPQLTELFAEIEVDPSATLYIPSEKERVQFMIIMILSSDEELSLIHFSSALEVSKNTALRDIKALHQLIEPYQVEIVYSRVRGYELVGNEWHIRRLLIDVLRNIFQTFNGESYIRELAQISTEEIERLKQKIEDIEKRLKLKFIDERIKHLPYVMAIIYKRIKKGKTITETNYVDYEALSDTKEFEAAEILIENQPHIPEQERLFITLKLLTSNILSAQALTNQEQVLPELKGSLKECIDLFEKKAAMTLKDKEGLIDKLFLHMKPAFYRIKYQLTTNYSMLDNIGDEFKAIHYIVKDSIKPLQDYIGCEIPESEIMFITILIGGHLINSGETLPIKKKAAVVCPNGISISQLMEHTLRDLFPEFYFYPAFSIREFESRELDYDLVFSPVPLQTDKHLILVNQFISNFEKMQLRQRVMKEVFGLKHSVVNIDNIISVIEKHATIKNLSALETALQEYFSLQFTTNEDQPEKNLALSDLITPETIILKDSMDSWQEALEATAKPLLKQGVITEAYIEKMKQQYPKMSPHILLGMNIAIPHAKPQDGVNRIGMSLLRIKEGLPIDENRRLHLIVVIAAVDKNKHLDALLQLMKVANQEDVIKDIVHLDREEDIFKLLEGHSK